MPSIEKHADISKQRTGKFNHLVEDVQVLADKTLAYFGAKKK